MDEVGNCLTWKLSHLEIVSLVRWTLLMGLPSIFCDRNMHPHCALHHLQCMCGPVSAVWVGVWSRNIRLSTTFTPTPTCMAAVALCGCPPISKVDNLMLSSWLLKFEEPARNLQTWSTFLSVTDVHTYVHTYVHLETKSPVQSLTLCCSDGVNICRVHTLIQWMVYFE